MSADLAFALYAIGVWCLASIPVAIFAGKVVRASRRRTQIAPDHSELGYDPEGRT